MLTDDLLQEGLALALEGTETLAGPALGELLRGKVRDSYVQSGKRTIVVTDRVSAFDVVLGTIPFKGQVLNGIAAHWFEESRAIVPNHLLEVPDPAVSIVAECAVFPVEMIVRGYLTGSSPTSIWTHYEQGAREYCGHKLPSGLRRHQRLPEPLVTPTTKAAHGEHDALISARELIVRGLMNAAEYEEAGALALELFRWGQRKARERGLILVDTKYELGRGPDGRIVLVDEVHTPDSSRYWLAEGYEEAVAQGGDPRPLDKDFVRRHLQAQGYAGEGPPPVLDDAFRIAAARRYAEVYEQLTGQTFEPNMEPPLTRIRRNLGL